MADGTGCSLYCGYVAAICCILSWGSAGVPLKITKTKATANSAESTIEASALVMQSYRTLVCFVTCWLVVFFGEEIRFSYWGIVSGIFWVPGAASGIYGIRNAGLALAVGTWSSIEVITSFIFGILIFHEQVEHFDHACLAFLLLIVGLVGMARYAEVTDETTQATKQHAVKSLEGLSDPSIIQLTNVVSELDDEESSLMVVSASARNNHSGLADNNRGHIQRKESNGSDDKSPKHKDHVVFCGGRVSLHRRQMGFLGAVVNGAWGGCALVPLHYAKRDHGLEGSGFLISFACGSLIVDAMMWLLLFLYNIHFSSRCRWHEALQAMPKWYWKELWKPCLLSGVLFSIGNFGSILAVTYLGQATGFSMCQLQLLVSGLWAVFFFGEIKTPNRIIKWFLSAGVAILGIVWLSMEQKGPALQ